MEIKITNARVNNLKNISLEIPRNKLVVITGVSGSGKSSLAFDTIYAEAQREYMDSLSTYSRISMPKIGKPDVDSIEGLSPCVVIDQKPLAKNPRSTVGTVTEIYSYLRMLFSRMGNPVLSAGDFSFNTPAGACECCKGLGEEFAPDLNLLLDYDKSLNENAIKHRTWKVGSRYWNIIKASELFDMNKPLKDYSKEEMDLLLYSKQIDLQNNQPGYVQNFSFQGIINRLIRRQGDSRGLDSNEYDRQFFVKRPCLACGGSRLNSRAREVQIHNQSIINVSNMEITELKEFVNSLEGPVAEMIVPYIDKMLQHLIDVGLGYLSISRSVATLSGGEAQKVKIAKQLGSSLSEIIYVMDEPTSGLHAKDVSKICKLIRELVDKNNTVIIVEHNKEMILSADHLIDIGPGAGVLGGECIAQGSVEELKNNPDSVTGKMLKAEGKRSADFVKRRKWKDCLQLKNVSRHNLKNISVDIPRDVMTCITGVSGSGKSTLVDELIRKYPEIIIVDQSAAGSNSRSNLATYVQAFNAIRKEWAKASGGSASLFTFNGDGACEACNGTGYQVMDMHFLGEIKNVCEECNGRRYKEEVLQYKYKGLDISEALNLTIAEAIDFFEDSEIRNKFKVLADVGLNYLTIGQSLDTLSGGERQRLKLAKYMSKKGNIYVLDEPTRGLSYDDINNLIELFHKLVDRKNTIILIEHNLNVIQNADYIIDLGPEGGKHGGRIVACGTPEQVAQYSASYTGKYLAKEWWEKEGKNRFLNEICLSVKKDRPLIQKELNYTIWTDTETNKFAQLWLKTRGCKYSCNTGGCTMCDYWAGSEEKKEDILEYLEQALSELKLEPEIMLLNTCGSVLDEWEITAPVREQLFRRLAEFKHTEFIIETHLETVTEETARQYREIFLKHRLQIEFGFESVNWWVQKYCINKTISESRVREKLDILRKYNITPVFNVLVGSPFLTLRRMYEDAMRTISWVTEQQHGNCVIFPVNIKDWTLVKKMEQMGLYKQPSLWLFVEVLTHLKPDILDRVEISWYKKRPTYIEGYKFETQAPDTCDKCRDKVIALLDEYVDSENRTDVIKRLSRIDCECRRQFYEEFVKEEMFSQTDILCSAYSLLGKDILGETWWEDNGKLVLNSIDPAPWDNQMEFKPANPFLDMIGRNVRRDAQRFWDDNDYFIREWVEDGVKEGGIWFKSQGCTHEWKGGCVMCDYSFGSKTDSETMIQCVKKALQDIKKPCKYLFITPSGSMLDEREVPEEARTGILKEFKRSENQYMCIETRADTVTLPVIEQCREILGNRFRQVWIGMECSNQWILKYCINKNIAVSDVVKAFEILKSRNIEAVANVLVGIPFLTPKENVSYAVASVKWALQHGCEKVCIFPVHVKTHTHLDKLVELGLYKPTSLWTYVEVLKQLRKEIEGGSVTIDWFETYGAYNIVYPSKTCDSCYKEVQGLLRQFTETKAYSVIEQLDLYECTCKDEWKKEYNKEEKRSLLDRVQQAYHKLEENVSGADWQSPKLEAFLQEMRREYAEFVK